MKLLILGAAGCAVFLLAAIINAASVHLRKKRIDAMIRNEYER